MTLKGKTSLKRQFAHVKCSDEEVPMKYFRDARTARAAMLELGNRSWEYQYEFAVEMARRCKQVMRDDADMQQALALYERWYHPRKDGMLIVRLKLNPLPPYRRFPLLKDYTFLTDLFGRAQNMVVSQEALQFALSFAYATSHKKPLHRILLDKSNPFGMDLLSQRQRALEKIVPEDIEDVELYDWEYSRDGKVSRVPSRIHLEWLCWGYTPDENGIWECAHRELGDRLSPFL